MTSRSFLLAGALAMAFAAPAQADTDRRFVISGAGWGHGIGMSQYGAKGMAEHGSSHRQILAHYYRSTTIGRAPNRTLRVLLQPNRAKVTISGARTINARAVDPQRTYTLTRRSGRRVTLLTAAGRKLRTLGAAAEIRGVQVRVHGPADNGVTGGRYRGVILVRPAISGGLNTINQVALESYLRGVVPAESPAAWPLPALRAQAVAARSYALATGGAHEQFDQFADVRSQMYRGVNGEQPRTDQAVADTRGQVLHHQGKVIAAYFFSTSGGHTESVQNVWPGAKAVPYLTAVPDPYDTASPYHRWKVTMTARQIKRRLGGLVRGELEQIKVTARGVSPRVRTAKVVGSRGERKVTGAELQRRLGLRDTWFTVTAAPALTVEQARSLAVQASQLP